MNICISQTVHNHLRRAREVARSPYLVRRAERDLFMNSENGFVLFPCRTTRAPCRISPLKLPRIFKFMSPPLRCPQWDVAPWTCFRIWKTIFNNSDNTLSQISPVRHDVIEGMPTSLVNSATTKLKLRSSWEHVRLPCVRSGVRSRCHLFLVLSSVHFVCFILFVLLCFISCIYHTTYLREIIFPCTTHNEI